MTDVTHPGQPQDVRIVYRNHRNVTAWRRILPIRIWFGECQWHTGPQWLLEAMDLDKDAVRTFAIREIITWCNAKETI